MILYHYTSRHHHKQIVDSGVIKTTESNIGSGHPDFKPYGVDVGPRVVWLTSQPDVVDGHGLNGSLYNKFEVRFQFDLVDAIKWSDFATQHGINKHWYRILDKAANYTARYWWVLPRFITLTEIKNIQFYYPNGKRE